MPAENVTHILFRDANEESADDEYRADFEDKVKGVENEWDEDRIILDNNYKEDKLQLETVQKRGQDPQ